MDGGQGQTSNFKKPVYGWFCNNLGSVQQLQECQQVLYADFIHQNSRWALGLHSLNVHAAAAERAEPKELSFMLLFLFGC